MSKLIKWLLYLLITGIAVLIIYAFVGPLVFDVEFDRIKNDVFWNEDIKDLSNLLFRV